MGVGEPVTLFGKAVPGNYEEIFENKVTCGALHQRHSFIFLRRACNDN